MNQTNKPVPDVDALKYKGTPEKPDIKIFVSHRIDLDSETIDNPLYIPVRCGAVFDERDNVEMLGDDTGDNISDKRDSFCELTVLYWAWKNVKADYYGLCHYRRYLSFSNIKTPYLTNSLSSTGLVFSPNFDVAISNYKLDDSSLIKKAIINEDAVFLEEYDVQHVGYSSIYELWQRDIFNFDVKVLDAALEVISVKYPYMNDVAREYTRNNFVSYYNLFMMKYETFNEYCNFLFGVLFEVEKKIDFTHYNSEKQRIIGYLGEHLQNIFALKLKKECKKVKHQQGIFIDEVVKSEEISPAFSVNNNTIVLSSSDFFCPYLGVALESLVENISHDQNYDIIIMHKEIRETNKKKLESIIESHTNCSLRFVNVKNIVYNTKFFLPEDNKELSEETYYTILVPWVLKNFNKALVLDCDIIIKKDISELFNIELGSNFIAAAREYLYHGFLNNPFINVDGALSKYCKENLELEDEYDYFNAGVLLLNLEIFREKFELNDLLMEISNNKFSIVEQDLLNKICAGRVLYLDYKWNYMACLSDETIPQISLVSEFEKKRYLEDAKSPGILHYITQAKPWKYPELQYADSWWEYARKSAFYEVCVYRMTVNSVANGVKRLEPAIFDLQRFAGFVHSNDPRTGVRKFADKLMPKGSRRREFAKKILPKGSHRWRFCKQIYYIFKPQYRPTKTKD